jgi:hypothetical protein
VRTNGYGGGSSGGGDHVVLVANGVGGGSGRPTYAHTKILLKQPAVRVDSPPFRASGLIVFFCP